jgi:hypothetical protein
MPFTENFSDFINQDTPGYVEATILGESVPGIFDNDSSPVSIGFSDMQARSPRLACASDDVENVVDETPVLIGAVTYRVAALEPDGTGITVLELKK